MSPGETGRTKQKFACVFYNFAGLNHSFKMICTTLNIVLLLGPAEGQEHINFIAIMFAGCGKQLAFPRNSPYKHVKYNVWCR